MLQGRALQRARWTDADKQHYVTRAVLPTSEHACRGVPRVQQVTALRMPSLDVKALVRDASACSSPADRGPNGQRRHMLESVKPPLRGTGVRAYSPAFPTAARRSGDARGAHAPGRRYSCHTRSSSRSSWSSLNSAAYTACTRSVAGEEQSGGR